MLRKHELVTFAYGVLRTTATRINDRDAIVHFPGADVYMRINQVTDNPDVFTQEY